MTLAFTAGLNLAAECVLALGALWLIATCLSPRTRVLLTRAAVLLALYAPLSLLAPTQNPSAVTMQAPLAPGAPSFGLDGQALMVSTVWETALLAIWAAGAALVLARSALSHLWLTRAYRAGRAPNPTQARMFAHLGAEIAPKARVSLRISLAVRAPCTFGWLAPKVLLPPSVGEDELRAVLAHELHHVRAHDALWLTLMQLACALHWFNPVAWLLARGHRQDIETVCDDEVTRGGVAVDQYVRALVTSATEAVRAPAASISMSSGALHERVRALLHRRAPLPRPGALARVGVFTGAAILATMMMTGDLLAARDPVLALGREPEAGHGFVYVRAGPGVTVENDTSMCSDNALCRFEYPLGTALTLYGRTNAGGRVAWSGCENEGGVCRVVIGETPARVSAVRG